MRKIGVWWRRVRRYFQGPVESLRFYVEGTDEQGWLTAEGHRAPWFVFDEDRQDWAAGPFAFRWRAIVAARRLIQGEGGY